MDNSLYDGFGFLEGQGHMPPTLGENDLHFRCDRAAGLYDFEESTQKGVDLRSAAAIVVIMDKRDIGYGAQSPKSVHDIYAIGHLQGDPLDRFTISVR